MSCPGCCGASKDDAPETPKEGENPKDTAMAAVKPNGKRSCTDVLCLLFFICFWIGSFGIVAVGFTTGDPDRLRYALDYKYDQCSRNNTAAARGLLTLDQTIETSDGDLRTIKLGGRDHSASPFYYLLGTGGAVWPGVPYLGVCNDACYNEGGDSMLFAPEDWVCTGKFYGMSNKPTRITGQNVPRITEFSADAMKKFVADVGAFKKSAGEEFKLQYEYLSSFFLLKDAEECEPTAASDAPECSVCYPVYPSISVQGALCVPDPEWVEANARKVQEVFAGAYNMSFVQAAAASVLGGDGGEVVMTVLQDAYSALPLVLSCIAFGLVLAFVYNLLLRSFIKPMVYVTIFGVLAGLTLSTYLLSDVAFEMRGNPRFGVDELYTNLSHATLGCFAFSGACLALYIVALFCFWSRIFLAVGVIIEASRALERMPQLLAVPIVPALLTFGLFCYLLFGCFWIATTGQLKLDGNGFAQVEYDNTLKGMLAYHFFAVIWGVVFLNHLTTMIVAGGVSQWYFAPDKSKPIHSPVRSAARRALLYHTGSIAFGSLLVAIVRYIRYLMNWLKKYANKDNECCGRFLKCIFCCVDCCLRCFEKFLDFVSKTAYVIVMVESEPFCTAARHGFGYIMSNLGGLAMVNLIGDSFLFLGKVFVASMASGTCGLVLLHYPGYAFETESIILPFIITFIGAYMIASIFMDIFESIIDTIFLCFAIDEDKQLGYADGELKKFVKASSTRDQPKAKDELTA